MVYYLRRTIRFLKMKPWLQKPYLWSMQLSFQIKPNCRKSPGHVHTRFTSVWFLEPRAQLHKPNCTTNIKHRTCGSCNRTFPLIVCVTIQFIVAAQIEFTEYFWFGSNEKPNWGLQSFITLAGELSSRSLSLSNFFLSISKFFLLRLDLFPCWRKSLEEAQCLSSNDFKSRGRTPCYF